MHYSLSEALRNLQAGQMPEFALEPAEKAGGLLGFFAKKPTSPDPFAGMEGLFLENPHPYYVKALQPVLKALYHQPMPIFAQPAQEARAFLSKISDLHQAQGYYAEICQVLVGHGWLTGERYQVLRLLFFLMGHGNRGIREPFMSLLQGLPEPYRPELLLLLILGKAKQGRLSEAIYLIKSLWNLGQIPLDLMRDHLDELYALIEKETGGDFDGKLPSYMAFLLELEMAVYDFSRNFNPRENSKPDLQTMPVWDKMAALPEADQANLLTLISLFSANGNEYYFSTGRSWVHQFAAQWSERVVYDEVASMRCIDLYNKNGLAQQLPVGVVKCLNKLLEAGQLSDQLVERLEDYYSSARSRNQNLNDLEELLRNEAHRRLNLQGQAISWAALLKSGFHPVLLSFNHNPYHGQHPDQVKPYLRLIREVADLKLIKFYRVEKVYHFKILLNGEHFEMKTGDSFGRNAHQDLNELLFHKGIPYQFVTLHPQFFNKSIVPGSFSQNMQVVTLVNQATYNQFNGNFQGQWVVGFARTAEPVPVFLKNISELPELQARPELDNVDLESDAKFAVLRDQGDKLKPIEDWASILTHTLKYPQDGKPGKTWVQEANRLIGLLPVEGFRAGLALVLDTLCKGDEWFVDDEKLCALRGLTWMCRQHADGTLLFALQKVANRAYKKVPGGPLNAKLGNIALEGLVEIGTVQAFGIIGNLQAKAKYPVFQRAIASNMKKFKSLLDGISPEELQDRVVPDHELVNGQKTIPVGAYRALLNLEGLKVELVWENEKGKQTSSVPAELQRDFVADVKAVKASAKSIEETLTAQAQRLEHCWIQSRSWAFAQWKAFFAGHPLMGVLVARLIWQAGDEDPRSFTWQKGMPVDHQGLAMDIADDLVIRLWHPATAEVAEVMAWRSWLFAKQVKQPFKQAFREVYLLTPAEETAHDHSNRFAGHHLSGNTLYSLGKTREWIMGYDTYPLRRIPNLPMVAELAINGGVLFANCDTLSLCFRQTESAVKHQVRYNSPKIPLKDVPPVILSEVMRDVDLFVAIANVGLDPYFDQKNSGDLLQYWREVSFGNKSKTSISDIRRDLLARLLPMTKIASKCKLDDSNWLYVQGKLKRYKINLGSGNILMEPTDQYLCIVPAGLKAPGKQIWLPFEGGDQVLMVILSKAFLLADDDKITDSTILRQLGR